jgi:hypothetical protein
MIADDDVLDASAAIEQHPYLPINLPGALAQKRSELGRHDVARVNAAAKDALEELTLGGGEALQISVELGHGQKKLADPNARRT